MNIAENQDDFNNASLEADQLRQRCHEIMKAEKLSQAALQRETGIPHGTFTTWLGGTYAGSIENVNEKVSRWLASRDAKKQLALTIPPAPDFVATPTSARITQVLQIAQVMPDMALIVGGAGVGKTETAQQYAAENPNVAIITARPSSARANTFFTLMAQELGLKERNSGYLFDAVASVVKNRNQLIIIDEAQHLKMDALEELRALHDIHEVGICLLGNKSVHSRLTSGTNEADFAQLFSRFGMRLVLDKITAADVKALLTSWNVDGGDVTKTCRVIAKRPGALRVMSKTLRLAHMMASAEQSKITVDHIDTAYSQMSNGGTK